MKNTRGLRKSVVSTLGPVLLVVVVSSISYAKKLSCVNSSDTVTYGGGGGDVGPGGPQ